MVTVVMHANSNGDGRYGNSHTPLEEDVCSVDNDWCEPGHGTWDAWLLRTYLKHPLSGLERKKRAQAVTVMLL